MAMPLHVIRRQKLICAEYLTPTEYALFHDEILQGRGWPYIDQHWPNLQTADGRQLTWTYAPRPTMDEVRAFMTPEEQRDYLDPLLADRGEDYVLDAWPHLRAQLDFIRTL